MTPEQLKASILQYAIQGKLVAQRPEEGSGESRKAPARNSFKKLNEREKC